jgi:uncharacterized protein (TIGR02001 family)
MIGKRLLVLAVATVLAVTTAFGEEGAEKSWSIDLDTTFNSKYVWRGISLTNDPVFQPTVAVSWKGFTASFWGNMDLTDINNTQWQFNEIDLTLDYSWSWDIIDFSVGVIHYIFPNIGLSATTEIYGSVGLDVFLSPTLTVYQDVDQFNGTYANLSIGHTFEDVWRPRENMAMSVDLSGAVGYGSGKHNAANYGSSSAAFTDLLLALGLPLQIGEHWTVTPAVYYSILLDGRIRGAMANDANLWAGLSFTFSF